MSQKAIRIWTIQKNLRHFLRLSYNDDLLILYSDESVKNLLFCADQGCGKKSSGVSIRLNVRVDAQLANN